jgi:cytosine/adenosine deaminase-related metal-dependent hydrolase
MNHALHIRYTRPDGAPGDLYIADDRVAAESSGALPVDLTGYTLWPGLINAHDQLAANHYPRPRLRAYFDNAAAWEAMLIQLNRRAPYRQLRRAARADRLFIGGLKNLLSGALTVVHYGEFEGPLGAADYPVRVLRRYGCAHGAAFDRRLVESYLKAERDVPWVMRLAEGTDARAALAFGQIKKLGLVRSNTVLVHGVGFTADDMLNGAQTVRGLVWCPSSNRHLLGFTANVEMWQAAGGRVALGNASRLTADGDLLDEMRAALETGQVAADEVLAMVTTTPAAMFDIADAGQLTPGMWADWIALPVGHPLVGAHRADLALVVRGGVPQIGDPALMARFPQVEAVPAALDGRPKAVNRVLADRIRACRLREPGLELSADRPRTFFARLRGRR